MYKQEGTMYEQNELTRRQFMAYTAASGAGMLLPTVGEAGIWNFREAEQNNQSTSTCFL
ncbi:MAG: twin-arginine translocation signal domain-containing protein [Candidatus Electrothrix sp. AUS3]|nr:twin-arginine translocation signal domain-containing protein [Candidatus Electrothrix gigas]